MILEPRKIKRVWQCRLKILLHHVPAESSEARPLPLCASASLSVKWDNNSTVSVGWLWGLSELVHVRCLEQCPARGEQSACVCCCQLLLLLLLPLSFPSAPVRFCRWTFWPTQYICSCIFLFCFYRYYLTLTLESSQYTLILIHIKKKGNDRWFI